MRNRCRGKYSPAVASAIIRNYARLLDLCGSKADTVRGAMDNDDVLQETFLHVTHDQQCAAVKNDEEIVAHFVFRYRMVRFQTFKDETQHKKIPFEDWIKTAKEREEL